MKILKGVAIIIFSFLFINSARADITTGLMGWWKFDEGSGLSAADSSGNGTTGDLTGHAPTWATGKIGSNALTFNGTTQYVEAPSSANYDSIPGTWAVWIKTSTTHANPEAILLSRTDTNSRQGITLYIEHNTDFLGVQVYSGGAQVINANATSGTLTDNNWHHVAFVFAGNGQTSTFYVDGVAVGTATASGAWTFNSQVFRIGNSRDGFWKYFTGTEDDARIYNRALSATDVAQLYAFGNSFHTKRFNSARLVNYRADY